MSRSDSAYGRGELSLGAPRIHGELLKIGITISERTVSRYLRGRPTNRSQTWRTFFANHFGGQTFISPVMFADAHGDDIVVDAFDVPLRPAPSIDASWACVHGATIDWGPSHQLSSLGGGLGHLHLQDRTRARKSSGRDPPRHIPVATSLAASAPDFFRARRQCLRDRRQCEIKLPRVLGRLQFRASTRRAMESSHGVAGPMLRSLREVFAT